MKFKLTQTPVKATDTCYAHVLIAFNGVEIGHILKHHYFKVWVFAPNDEFTKLVDRDKRIWTTCDRTTGKTKAEMVSKILTWVTTGSQLGDDNV